MAPTALLFLLTLSCCSGIALRPPFKNDKNTASSYNSTLPQHLATENGSEELQTKDDILCARMHNNTALVGAEPFARLLLNSAKDCRSNCIEIYPKCVAVMFYYLHEEKEKTGEQNHVCYMFDTNSISKNVALIAEKPRNPLDRIRLLEITPDCHDFDAFPPLSESFATSTDRVPLRKRSSGYFYQPVIYGDWSTWSPCYGGIAHQVRTRPSEYGLYVHRRICPYTTMVAAQPVIQSYSLPHYPPAYYHLPAPHIPEYQLLMAQHAKQYQTACCHKWHQYMSLCPEGQECPLPKPAPCDHPCPPYVQPQYVIPEASFPPTYEIPPVMHVTVPPPAPPLADGTLMCHWMEWYPWSQCTSHCGIPNVTQRFRICSGDYGCFCPGNSWQQAPCAQPEPCKFQ